MHTLGEEAEAEEVLSSASPYAAQQQSRARTASNASSGTTQLRNEVVDLLQLARKASSGMSTSTSGTSSVTSSSGSIGDLSQRERPSLDQQDPRPSVSSGTRMNDGTNAASSGASASSQQRLRADYAPGTATKEELEELARAISPFPMPMPATKPRKKFGLFGGGAGKKADASKEKENTANGRASPLPPTSTLNRSVSPLPHPETRAAPIASQNMHMANAARRPPHPPIAGAHRNPISAQHRRKRSMSVGDAVPFAIFQSGRQASASSSKNSSNSHGVQRLTKPDVYDESYFSSSKVPYYYHSSLNDTGKKRSKQIDRLGLLGAAVDTAQSGDKEEESLQSAKERLLAQSGTVVGHPFASTISKRREGQHAGKVDEGATTSSTVSKEALGKRQGQLVVQNGSTGQYQLRNPPTPGQPQVNVTSWTTPCQQPVRANKTRPNRSNSDASFIDPFLPRADRNGSSPRPSEAHRQLTQLAVPSLQSKSPSHPQDSVKAIGPPPTTPLPSPPRTTASLPGLKAPSPSQQMSLPPAPSPAPTSPLPPLPAAICPPPTQHRAGDLPRPPTRAPPAVPSISTYASTATVESTKGAEEKAAEYGFELRPHRTKQQGRTKLSPLHEREKMSPDASALERATLSVTPRPFGTRGIVQRPPSALDMTLLPSPAPAVAQSSSSASSVGNTSTPSSLSLAASISSGSLPTPKAREFNQEQIRRRQETSTTVASQYSTEGDYESYDASRSSAASSSSSGISSAMSQRVNSGGSASESGGSSSAGHTTLSSTTSYSSNSTMSSYMTRPSLSMDGHSTSSCSDDYSVSTHDTGSNSYRDLRDISPYQYTYTHVNDAVPMKPPRNTSKMTPSPSCESVNNLAGIGLAGAASNVVFPHSRRMHFGWSRHKAMRDLSSHAEEEDAISHIHIEPIRIHDGNSSSDATSPGSEIDAYAGILGEYAPKAKREGSGDDEGYVGSSPEMTPCPTKQALSSSREWTRRPI